MNTVESYVIKEADGVRILDTFKFLSDFDESQKDEKDWHAKVNNFKKLCTVNNICYYADSKEDFFEHCGLSKAKKENAIYLVMENMS